MKNIYLLTVLLLGLVSSPSLLASDLKIGFVRASAIAQKLPQSKTMINNIQNEFKENMEQLKKLDSDIRALQEKGQKEAPTMTNSALTALKREIDEKISQLKLKETNLKEDIGRRQKEESFKLNRAITQAINVLAERDQFDLILLNTSIIFRKDTIIDITDNVVKMMTDPKSN